MPNDPTPALFDRVNQNIAALGGAINEIGIWIAKSGACLLYTSPSPRDGLLSRMPSSA